MGCGAITVVSRPAGDPGGDPGRKDVIWRQFLICNYGPSGNVEGEPVFQVGPPCSGCPLGFSCSPKFSGLCSKTSALDAAGLGDGVALSSEGPTIKEKDTLSPLATSLAPTLAPDHTTHSQSLDEQLHFQETMQQPPSDGTPILELPFGWMLKDVAELLDGLFPQLGLREIRATVRPFVL